MGRCLRRDGKLDGPDFRSKNVSWLDVLILPFIFFGRAAISFLILLYQFNYTTNIALATRALDILWNSTTNQIMLWFFLVFWAILRMQPIQLFLSLLFNLFKIVLYTLFGIPVVLYSFYKGVYNFGPKHYRKRGFWEIVLNPVPEQFETSTNKRMIRVTRERPAPIRRKLYLLGWDGR